MASSEELLHSFAQLRAARPPMTVARILASAIGVTMAILLTTSSTARADEIKVMTVDLSGQGLGP